MIFIGILLLLLLFGGMGGAVYFIMKKTDPKNVDSSLRTDISTAQEFLPFQRIKHSMIHMGNHNYRAIIEVSSINYDLKTEKEQRVIEMSYTQFLNSLMFPITIFISSREMDNRVFMENLQADYEMMLKDYPMMTEYANANFNDMATLNAQLGTTRQKKKYVIVSYDEAYELDQHSDAEKYEHSAKEILTRARMIQEGLVNLGIQTKLLNTAEIIELMISTYHRNGSNYSDDVSNGNYQTMIVEGERNFFGNDIANEEQLEMFVSEFENKIKTLFLSDEDVSAEAKVKAEEVLKMLKGEKSFTSNESNFDTFDMNDSNEEIWTDYNDEDEDEDEVDDFLQQPTQMKWQGERKQ